jgi:predicted Zn-dependent protease
MLQLSIDEYRRMPINRGVLMHLIRKFAYLWIASVLLLSQPGLRVASGVTVTDEEKMAKDFLKVIYNHYEFIDDPVVPDYVSKVGNRIVSKLDKPLFTYHFYVIKTDPYNAFAIPAGYIFINSGLLMAMDDEDELAGILAHEIAHVNARHISQKIEMSKKIGWARMAGMALGVLMGVAGAGDVGQAVTQSSAAAATTAELAYSREDEMQADQLGLDYLAHAGYSGEGLLKILKKMRSKEWFDSKQAPTYLMTHPAIDDRIAYLDTQIATMPKATRTDADKPSAEFERMLTQLITQYGDANLVLRQTEGAVKNDPADMLARHRFGLILARVGRRPEAIDQLRTVLEKRAFDPYVLRDMGRIYFLDGQYQEALKMLNTAHNMIPDDALCRLFLGQTQMELELYDQSSLILSKLVEQNPHYTEAYYFLGQSLGKQGNLADAYYYLAVYHSRKRDYQAAAIQYQNALKYTKDTGKRAEIEDKLKELKGALSRKDEKSE